MNIENSWQVANNLLTNISSDYSDIDTTKSTLIYLKVQDSSLVEATSQKEAQFARLNLFQNNIDHFKIYYPGANQSEMYFIFKEEDGYPRIVGGNYYHFLPDTKTFSDYPIITTGQAFEELKKGNAFIITGIKPGSTVDITDLDLGYYIGEENNGYVLPVFIFLGKNFTAYVPAIPPQLIEE